MNTLMNNYLPKAKKILSHNPIDEVEGIIRHYYMATIVHAL